MNYTKKAVRGASLVFLMIGLSYVFAYLVRIVLARNLDPSDYGLFYAVFTLILFLLIFRDIGLGSAATKFIAEYRVKKDYAKIKTIIYSSLIFKFLSSIILISVLLILSSFLSTYYFKTAIAAKILTLLTVYVFVSFLLRSMRDILRGFQDTRWYSLAEPLRLVITCATALLLFYLDLGVFSPVFAFIIGVVLTLCILFIGLFKYRFLLKYKIKDFWKTTEELFKFGIPVIFTGMGNKIIAHIDVLLLTYFVSLRGVGIYNVILPTAMTLIFFGRSLSIVLFPMISELWSKKDKIRASEGVRLIYVYSFVLLIPLLFTIFAFSDIVIRLLFGGEYVAGITAFRILLIGILFYTVAIVNNSAISGIGKPATVTKIISVAAVVNIVLNVVLIPQFKLTGAALATTVSYLIILILSTVKLIKFIELASPWKMWLKTFFSGLLFVGILFILKAFLEFDPWVELITGFLVASIVYAVLILKLKVVDIAEIKKIVKRLA